MEHVVVRWDSDQGGYWVDPRAYQASLHELAADLPQGAREFALDPQHYDFASDRCVKDLWFRSLTVDAAGTARLSFGPNRAKHTEGLDLVYYGVTFGGINRQQDPGVGWLGSLLLDELRASPDGVAHEFAMTGGSLHVVAEDLKATWG